MPENTPPHTLQDNPLKDAVILYVIVIATLLGGMALGMAKYIALQP